MKIKNNEFIISILLLFSAVTCLIVLDPLIHLEINEYLLTGIFFSCIFVLWLISVFTTNYILDLLNNRRKIKNENK